MHVQAGKARLNSAQNVNVVVAVESARQAALDTHLCGSSLDRVD